MVSVLFALLTAFFNGLASVLQRMAAAVAPAKLALRLSLLAYLVRRRVWLLGITMVIFAAVCQAIALATGPVRWCSPSSSSSCRSPCWWRAGWPTVGCRG